MRKVNVIRAWKDPAYRDGLNSEELSLLSPHPAGLVELTDRDLRGATGLAGLVVTTAPECTMYTYAKHRCCPKP